LVVEINILRDNQTKQTRPSFVFQSLSFSAAFVSVIDNSFLDVDLPDGRSIGKWKPYVFAAFFAKSDESTCPSRAAIFATVVWVSHHFETNKPLPKQDSDIESLWDLAPPKGAALP